MKNDKKIFDNFFTKPQNIYGDTLILEGDEFFHCIRVSRNKRGDVIGVIDGKGKEYICTIQKISKDKAECRIERTSIKPREPFCEITLIQSLIKGERFEFVIEKAVELGVSELIPVTTERTIPKPGIRKINRWNKIALSALKQCGGSVLPKIKEVLSFQEALKKTDSANLKLIAFKSENSKQIDKVLNEVRFSGKPKIAIAIGPEGDFTSSEIDSAVTSSFIPVSLGDRRLRSETASIIAAGIIIDRIG